MPTVWLHDAICKFLHNTIWQLCNLNWESGQHSSVLMPEGLSMGILNPWLVTLYTRLSCWPYCTRYACHPALERVLGGTSPLPFLCLWLMCLLLETLPMQFWIWQRTILYQVEEQGELAIRIDENVDDTLANVDSAQDQLLKYLNSISSNRWLIMKIFFVLMLFLVVFVVFVA